MHQGKRMEPKNILQRYMDLPKFMYLLQREALFLPKMSVFDDQLEGGLTAKNYLSTSNGAAIIDNAMNGLWPSASETVDERSIRLEKANSTKIEIRQREFKTPFGIYNCEDIDKVFPRCREWLYVSCWHKSMYECSAMWSLYGGDNNSVCIFTTEEKLKSLIQASENIDRINLYDIDYIDHKKASLSDECLAPFLAKSLPFSFEKETRLIAYDSKVNLNSAVENNIKGIEIAIGSLPQLIDKVVISPNADAWFASSVKQLCEEKGLKIIVDSTLRTERVDSFYGALKQFQENSL
jgi:hypothetical protein